MVKLKRGSLQTAFTRRTIFSEKPLTSGYFAYKAIRMTLESASRRSHIPPQWLNPLLFSKVLTKIFP
jgi:hypothetical protein